MPNRLCRFSRTKSWTAEIDQSIVHSLIVAIAPRCLIKQISTRSGGLMPRDFFLTSASAISDREKVKDSLNAVAKIMHYINERGLILLFLSLIDASPTWLSLDLKIDKSLKIAHETFASTSDYQALEMDEEPILLQDRVTCLPIYCSYLKILYP